MIGGADLVGGGGIPVMTCAGSSRPPIPPLCLGLTYSGLACIVPLACGLPSPSTKSYSTKIISICLDTVKRIDGGGLWFH